MHDRAIQKDEIPLRVSLFSVYTHPFENFAVMVNGDYVTLDKVITGIEPREIDSEDLKKRFAVYDVIFMTTHCDGGYESRTRKVERRLPHPAPLEPYHIELYHKLINKWNNAIDSYRNELESRCSSTTVQLSTG